MIMKNTREKILRTLLSNPESSIKDLAEDVGINGISIRHHLSSLEAEGLIVSSEERHGVGRPRLIYSLTEKGVERFPTSYLKLTHRLISKLKETLSKEQLVEIFQEIGSEIAENYDIKISNQTTEERLDRLQEILSKEGFIVDWVKQDGTFHLQTLSCPYFQIGLEHPEVCNLDHALVSSLFPEPVVIKSCIFQGDASCIYEIRPNLIKETSHE